LTFTLFFLAACNRFDPHLAEDSESILHVEFLNVGQGSATAIQTNSQWYLVDAGPDSAGLLASLQMRKVDTLDWVFITHNHRDHIGGLWELIGKIPIRKIWVGTDRSNLWALDSVKQLASKAGIELDSAYRDVTIPFAKPWILRVLWPEAGNKLSENAASAVLWIGDACASILWTGDLDTEQERNLLSLEKDLRATVIQVGHHGSATSSSLELIGSIQPEIALIGVGTNPWGHPRKETLERLSLVLGDSSKIYRTDRDGSVSLDLVGGFGLFGPERKP
jgi:competence protein ComEC